MTTSSKTNKEMKTKKEWGWTLNECAEVMFKRGYQKGYRAGRTYKRRCIKRSEGQTGIKK